MVDLRKWKPLPDTFSIKNNVAGLTGLVVGVALIGGLPGFLGGLVVGELIDYYYVTMRKAQP
jgi:hypothetical protein